MSEPYPIVEIATVLIRDAEGRFLVDFNERWGRFNLPASKRRQLPPRVPGSTTTLESPLAAAIRAAAEVIGRPLAPPALLPLGVEVPPFHQSGRDGKWKRYTIHAFTLLLDFPPQPLPGHSAVWLTGDEIETLEPISPTLRDIVRLLPN